MHLRWLGLLLMLASIASGQDVTIKGDLKVPPYRLVKLSIDGDIDSAVWFVSPRGQVDSIVGTGGRFYSFVAPPGVYDVFVTTLKANRLGQAETSVQITGTPIPPPGPTPDPNPTPTPTPPPPVPPPTPPPVVTGKLWVRLIYDPDAADTTVALRGSAQLQTDLAALNADWTVWSASDPIIDAKRLAPYIQKYGGTPLLIVQGPDGKVLYPTSTADKLKATPAELVTLVKRLRGGP